MTKIMLEYGDYAIHSKDDLNIDYFEIHNVSEITTLSYLEIHKLYHFKDKPGENNCPQCNGTGDDPLQDGLKFCKDCNSTGKKITSKEK